MKHDIHTTALAATAQERAANDALAIDQLARRKILLKAVSGGGVAALAAVVPVKVFAAGNCTGEGVCSVSGMQSAGTSYKPGGDTTAFGGWSPGWWGQTTTDPTSSQDRSSSGRRSSRRASEETPVPRRPWPTSSLGSPTHLLKVNDVLAKSGLTVTLFDLMTDSTYSNSDERHWVCAWLNALAAAQGIGPTGYAFPYTADQVLNFYAGTGDQPADLALVFFKGYMETHTGT